MNNKKILLVAATTYAAGIAASKSIKTKRRTIRPYFNGRSPYIFAHRGGMKLAPENTLAAFNEAARYDVDGFEIDVRLTKDDEIVVLHDKYVDRVSNGSGQVRNHTLEELRTLDFGYHFKDINGEYSFRGSNETKVVTLKELIQTFPQMRINIDMKDAPETTAGQLIPSLLYRLIDDLNAFDQVLVTSFYDENIQRFKMYAGDKTAIGASQKEVTKAFSLLKSGYGSLYQPAVDTFQIPVQYKGIRLDGQSFINFLQDRNIAVGYWVINSVDQMDDLIQKGAHTIVTDRPDLAYHLVKEKYKK